MCYASNERIVAPVYPSWYCGGDDSGRERVDLFDFALREYHSLYREYIRAVETSRCGVEGRLVSVDGRCGDGSVVGTCVDSVREDPSSGYVGASCVNDQGRDAVSGVGPLGLNTARNRLWRQKKKERKIAKKANTASDAYWEARAEREKYQLEISRIFADKQKKQIEIDEVKMQVAKLRADQQLKIWDHSDEALLRRRKEVIAKSEVNIAKYEAVRRDRIKRKEKQEEISRKETWRNGAKGTGSQPPSAVTSVPSVGTSVSARSSASQVKSRSTGLSSTRGSHVSFADKPVEKKKSLSAVASLQYIVDEYGNFSVKEGPDNLMSNACNREPGDYDHTKKNYCDLPTSVRAISEQRIAAALKEFGQTSGFGVIEHGFRSYTVTSAHDIRDKIERETLATYNRAFA